MTGVMQLVEVDPATLHVADQVRSDATPTPELVDSVRRHGLLEAPTVVWDTDLDGYRIVYGHRRVGAAIAAGLDRIHVIVRPDTPDDAAAVTVEQIVENEHRTGLSPVDLARGYRQLELLGRTPEEIAAALAATPERVRAGLRVAAAGKDVAAAVVERGLDLEWAAQITEFEDQAKTTADLLDTATRRPQDFPWKVEQARAARDLKQLKDDLTSDLKAQGVTVHRTTETASWWRGANRAGRALRDLVDGAGTVLTEESHASCPGHAAIVTGTPYQAAEVVYVCDAWRANGHTIRAGAIADVDEGAAQRDADRAARLEEERAARDANTTARLAWVRSFLTGRLNQTPGLGEFTVDALVGLAQDTHGRVRADLVRHLLDGSEYSPSHPGYMVLTQAQDELERLVAERRFGAQRILTAYACATFETALVFVPAATVRYLRQLQAWGYPLSSVDEQTITDAESDIADAEHDDEEEDQ